jgi:uncharacterized protein
MTALIKLLAARSGQLLVASALSNETGLSNRTTGRYLDLLDEVFLTRRIPAWSRNLSTRATGTPKVAMVDSGVATNLLGVADRLGDDLVVGIVLYTGTQTLPFGDRMRAVPVSALWE